MKMHTGNIKLPNAANCMECNNCTNSCSHEAIKLKYDFWGRPYPFININSCIGCRLCERNCPENTKDSISRVSSKSCYAVIANRNILEESSSGGFATILSQLYLKEGGIVVGAAFDNFPYCHHIIAKTNEDLIRIQKSKYIYSQLDSILPELKNLITKSPECKVLFFGIPCQIAAAKNYLNNRTNILYIEILCHGTMSNLIFPKYLKGINNHFHIQGIDFLFRGNKKDPEYLVFHKPEIIDSTKKRTKLTKWYKWFLVSFLEGYAYRTKCYNCNYVGSKRIGDITIGDFWGIGRTTKFHHEQKDGVSLVLINTEKGNKVFENIRNMFAVVEERPISEPSNQNQTLKEATEIPKGNRLYHLLLIILPWWLLLPFHKIRYYYLKIFRAFSWRINSLLK